MFIKIWFAKIDSLICSYLGLKGEGEEVRPNAVQLVYGKILIAHACSFKRHIIKESWDNFKVNMHQINVEDREKLGLAAGKTIAKNLVVSFEVPLIRKN